MQTIDGITSYHAAELIQNPEFSPLYVEFIQKFQYDFENFFHPFVGSLIQQLNLTDIAEMLSPDFLSGLTYTYQPSDYVATVTTTGAVQVKTTLENQSVDVQMPGGPYAVYNWELCVYIPLAIAVHLSNNQRFAEAQKWFQLVFDPTDPEGNFWKSYAFASGQIPSLDELLSLLSEPDWQLQSQDSSGGLVKTKALVIAGYNAIQAQPFNPFVVARTRPSAFQWYAVMKYLDNLIAWGDSLFLQDTIETLNEATLCYVRASNLLGPRPQVMPRPGTTSVKNFRQLKQAGLDAMSNALVELESQFPFNTSSGTAASGTDQSGALFGIGRSLYFCIPQNHTLLAYWDTVADRLFKIRNSENIQGVFQQLPLFDPPLDPGMLVKAAAAGIDISAIVSGVNQPIGPLRSLPLIQKALELGTEVKAMGASLLAAIEKGDAEHLAQLHQGHEIELQTLMENVRFLEWKHAQETTNGLLASRAGAVERYTYYLRLLGLTPDSTTVPPTLTPDSLNRSELTESNWDDTYNTLVGTYAQAVATQKYGSLQLDQGSSPSAQAGATGLGQLYLNTNEASELNTLLPHARDLGLASSIANAVAGGLILVPDFYVDGLFMGIGAHTKITGGDVIAEVVRIGAETTQLLAAWDRDQAGIASQTAGYQRRTDEWKLQANLAAEELMAIGEQILASLIAEQVAYHNYTTAQTQIQQAQAVQDFLQSKFTSETFYIWMQSQLSGLYYQYYRFACDTARRAELTMKQELMRPELEQTQYIQFNYWDAGHRGLLSGEALCLDLKRLEMAYHDNNKRELEMTRQISLRQLDPVALLTLRITGSCTITVPEWLYDLDTPGHYMRRIKSVALTIPSVVGPYINLSAALTLLSSAVRTSSELANGVYGRTGQNDARFTDYFGSTDMIVTSTGTGDSGMFETNLNEERFLPFEGAGAVGVWNLSLPSTIRLFDYTTISDVILQIHYTARPAGNPLISQATKELVQALDTAGKSSQALMFCLRFDFPNEWAAFVNGTAPFQAVLSKFLFPYMVQGAPKLTIDGLTLYAASGQQVVTATPLAAEDLAALATGLSGSTNTATLTLPQDPMVLTRDKDQFVFLVLQYHFGLG
jgi:Tc toxin complex TcA C-terminal TcB-binding domain